METVFPIVGLLVGQAHILAGLVVETGDDERSRHHLHDAPFLLVGDVAGEDGTVEIPRSELALVVAVDARAVLQAERFDESADLLLLGFERVRDGLADGVPAFGYYEDADFVPRVCHGVPP